MLLQRARIVGVIGVCLGVFSMFIGFSWKYIFYKMLEKYLTIRPNSLIFDLWHAPPTKIVIDFYMFNWTNPEDFRNPNIKPKFQELGPYRYFEAQEKVDIVWNTNNATVSYGKKSIYQFDAEGTRGSLNDRIVTLNSIAVAASKLTKDFSYSKRLLAEFGMMIYPRDLTLRKTVDELLFSGFSDTLLSALNVIPMSGIEMPFAKYGYCYGRNDSSTYFGNFNVHTGGYNVSDMGQMYAWNFKNYSTSYPRECSKIRGSAGEFQGPNMKVNSTTSLYVREFCRDIPLEFDSESDVDGVPGYKFVAGHRAIDNGTLYPENACLCNGECLPSGVMNVSGCWFESPLFVSYPHFYKADPYYLRQVDGLSPDKKKHEFFYIIEPKTSIGMHIVARTQMNQLIRPIYNSRMFHDAREIMFPLFWAEASTRLTPDLLDYFRLVDKLILCGQILSGFFCIIGIYMAMKHPVSQRLKQKFWLYLCSPKLQAAIEVDEATEIDITDDIKKDIEGSLLFQPYKHWKELENHDISKLEISPSKKPLLT